MHYLLKHEEFIIKIKNINIRGVFMSKEELGCCGAYCKTCKVFIENLCKGCKLGYKNGERDINKAKCKMKICCIKNNFYSCADCPRYSLCNTINEFYNKNGFKYKKYKQAIEYIRQNGYDKFFKIADNWKNVYGKYE
jgi:hypothetical protein